MTDLTALGVDIGALPSQSPQYPSVVAGRVANIDADFIAYQVACETKAELDGLKPRRSLEHMKKQVLSIALHQQKLVGAERYVLFITPPGSDKGGRDAYAVNKPYQGNRADKVPPEHLDAIRAYMGEECPSNISLNQEADDALAQANYAAIAAGTPELTVLCSKDKDLKMVPGYYYDFDAEEVKSCLDTFGYIEVDRSKSAAKVVGRGTKFFWAQCLMGDTADNIAGLPKCFVNGKDKSVGPVAAYNFLKDCEDDGQCYDVVRELWSTSRHEWINWKTQQPSTWGEALYGDMHLLWMRRTPDDRVDDFLKEVIEAYVPWKTDGTPSET